jgi:glycopeptide antibiotics resistance protein
VLARFACVAAYSELPESNAMIVQVSNMHIHAVIMVVNIAAVLLCGLIWLGVALFLRVRKRKSFVYVLFFTIFYVYIIAVLDYTIFQFQSLLLLNYLSPHHLILKGNTVAESVNLIPLIALRLADAKTSLLNILMLVPFGFGLPFITQLQIKRVVIMGAVFSITIELLQLLTGAMAHMTFRTADINDVLFNTIGTAIGYVLFIWFKHLYCRAERCVWYS